MPVIWKFPFSVTDAQTVLLPTGARALHVDDQRGILGELALWALVSDPDAALEPRAVRVVGTGRARDDLTFDDYVGTVLQQGLIWHVFVSRGVFGR